MTIYQAIDTNRTRTWILVVVFVLFVAAVVQVFSLALGFGPELTVLALLLASFTALWSYYFSDRMVLGIANAREVKEEDAKELYHIVENLCIGSGLPMPKVYLIDDSAPNAFATGRDPQHSAIAVTTGLLSKLDKLELEGVIAHELSHIRDYDIRLMSMVVVLVGMVALLADWFLRFTWFGSGSRRTNSDRGGGSLGAIILIIALLLAILAPIAAQLVRLAISRRREFLADASAALLTRYPEGLASALEKLEADQDPLEVANKATAHLYIVNPLKGHQSWLNNLFSTHPPIEERIAALRAM